MKFFALLITFFLSLMTVNAHAAKITSDELNLGRPGSSSDKVINLGPTRFIRSNETTGKLEFSNDGGTIVKEIGSGSGSGDGGGINLLSNSSFEDGSPPQDWTSSGGTFTQETFANGVESDEKFARFVATGAGQYIESSLVTVPDDFSFGMMADVRYSSGSDSFDLVILDSTGSITYSSSSFSDLVDWDKKPTDTFQAPDAGTQIKMRIISTGAGTIDLNKAYLGSNKGFIASQSSEKDLGVKFLQSDQSGFSDNELTDLTFSNLKIGNRYRFYHQCHLGALSTSEAWTNVVHNGTGLARCRWNGDGSTTFSGIGAGVSGEFVATDTILQVRGNAAGGVPIRGNGTYEETWFQVIDLGPEQGAQEAFTPDQSSFNGETVLLYSTANATVNVNNMQNVNTSGAVTVENASQLCAGTEQPSGGACTTQAILGYRRNFPTAGKYEICAKFSSDASNANMAFALNHVSNSDSNSKITDNQHYRNGTGENRDSHNICEIFEINNAGLNSFSLQSGSDGTSSILMDNVDGTSLTNEQRISFTIKAVSHNISRPVIQNMVDTSVSDGVRVTACRIDNNGTATLDPSSGLCESWIDSATRTSLGAMTINFKAGIFSSDAVCTFNTIQNTSDRCGNVATLTANQVETKTYNCTTGALADRSIVMTCHGRR